MKGAGLLLVGIGIYLWISQQTNYQQMADQAKKKMAANPGWAPGRNPGMHTRQDGPGNNVWLIA